MKLDNNQVITLCRLSAALAARFGRIGTDEMGEMAPEDKKLMESVVKQCEKVLSSNLKAVKT